ncbi:MAG: type II toxin-antitoxin system prevent-host-death family antitoxin [Chloroflexi bacterium]|nr:type II toxin-antitoxin system prevent-host-death family antitoxin [Chloroflexota bacterium]
MSARRIEMAQATKPLAEYAQQVDEGEQPLVVTSSGRPVVVVIPIADEDDLESFLLGKNKKFLEIIERSRARYAKEGGLSEEEVRRRYGL